MTLTIYLDVALQSYCRWAADTSNDRQEQFDGDMQLALGLLLERFRGRNSKWHHFVRSLPKEILPIHKNYLRPSEVDRFLNGTITHQAPYHCLHVLLFNCLWLE